MTAFNADAQAFAAAWTRRTGLRQELTMGEAFYEIGAPPADRPGGVPGAARLAAEADVPLTAGWLRSFNLEVVPSRAAMDAEQVIRQRLAHGWLVLWENDGEPVSMAGVHPAVAGVSRIGPVYTPGWHRRRGYGAAVTLAATRLSFGHGARRCVLFADAANPTSNGIYQAIGYRQIGEAQMIGFR